MGSMFKRVKTKTTWPYVIRCSQTMNGHWIKSVWHEVRERSMLFNGRFYLLVQSPDFTLDGWAEE